MHLQAEQLGKRYNRQWIFRHLTIRLEQGIPVAITGSNGSGKSTLLQVLAGMLAPSEGKILWHDANRETEPEQQYAYMGFCAPYLELIEELTLTEFLNFHRQFKPWMAGLDTAAILDALGLQASAHKLIRDCSSGMKQRVKLSQAILSDVPCLFLDEPTSNLDRDGIQLYLEWMDKYASRKLVVIASNDEAEIAFCRHRIAMQDIKR